MTNYEDKILKCKDCGGDFTWTAGEQKFYAEKGLNAPIRCKECRAARKAKYATTNPVEKTEEEKNKSLDDMLKKFQKNTVEFKD